MSDVSLRVCPICDGTTTADVCPLDGVATLRLGADPTELGGDDEHAQPGDVLADRYRLERHLESGAMGAVYVATQLSMNRTVAVKLLPACGGRKREQVRRFFVEAQLVARLNHPNVVRAVDFGMDQRTGSPFLVMEFIEGQPLHRVLKQQGALPQVRAVSILLQVTRALCEAHRHGVVHRDLKPANLIVTRLADGGELVKVLDFGVAKMLDATGKMSGYETMTDGGQLVGTPEYMSPEQARARDEIDGRADLYSVGCIAHELLTGRPPFVDDDPLRLLQAQLNQAPPRLPDETVDGRRLHPELRRLIDSLLAKQPGGRPYGAPEVARALKRVLAAVDSSAVAALPRGGTIVSDPIVGEPPRQRALPWVLATVAGMIAGSLIGLLYEGPERPAAALASTQANVASDGAQAAVEAATKAELVVVSGRAPKPRRVVAEPKAPQPEPVEPLPVPTAPPLPEPVAAVEGPAERVAERVTAAPAAALGASLDGPADAAPAEGEGTAVEEAATQEAPAPRMIKLVSRPAGATVYEDGKALGRTPLHVAVPAEGAKRLRVVAKGRQPRTLSVDARAGDVVSVELPKPSKRSAKPPKKGRAEAVKKTAKEKPPAKKPPSTRAVPVW